MISQIKQVCDPESREGSKAYFEMDQNISIQSLHFSNIGWYFVHALFMLTVKFIPATKTQLSFKLAQKSKQALQISELFGAVGILPFYRPLSIS